jgi:proteasome accessory factor B
MPASKTARWLDLIAFLLQHRFPVTREQIYQSVAGYKDEWRNAADDRARESLRRKFERDKDELRAMGVGIETLELPDRAGDEATVGYRLRAGDFYLPYLELASGGAGGDRPYSGVRSVTVAPEHLALLDRATRRLADRTEFPLARAAASARRKLAFDLPIPLQQIERVLAAPVTSGVRDTLAVLQQAVAGRVAVACTYYTIGRDVADEREIEPHGLFFSWGRWYAVAAPRGAAELQVFRVDRMSDAKLIAGPVGGFELRPDFDIKAYVGRQAWELSSNEPQRVRVRFAFPESRWVMAQGVGEPIVPLTDDGGAEIAFQVRDSAPFLRWLLTFRDHAGVLDPAELAEELTALKQRVASLYQSGGAHG